MRSTGPVNQITRQPIKGRKVAKKSSKTLCKPNLSSCSLRFMVGYGLGRWKEIRSLHMVRCFMLKVPHLTRVAYRCFIPSARPIGGVFRLSRGNRSCNSLLVFSLFYWLVPRVRELWQSSRRSARPGGQLWGGQNGSLGYDWRHKMSPMWVHKVS